MMQAGREMESLTGEPQCLSRTEKLIEEEEWGWWRDKTGH